MPVLDLSSEQHAHIQGRQSQVARALSGLSLPELASFHHPTYGLSAELRLQVVNLILDAAVHDPREFTLKSRPQLLHSRRLSWRLLKKKPPNLAISVKLASLGHRPSS